ncbi:battenin-like [Diadema antillarum]|uniref:battenin-like n=1 Tax=Diadema antillarum TaxID=105358 RepID=UPI003A84F0EE
MPSQEDYFCRNWVGFFLLGLSNVLPSAMVNAAANSIARSFHKGRFVATVYGAAGSTTILVKLLNTFVLTRVSYNIRFGINSLVLLLGIAGIAFASSFITAIFGVVVVGTGYAFGENLALGYLSRFDSRLVNAWSSGAGCAGLLGAISVILSSCFIPQTLNEEDKLQLMDWYSFLACCPFVFLYIITYFLVIQIPPDEDEEDEEETHDDNGNNRYDINDDDGSDSDSGRSRQENQNEGAVHTLSAGRVQNGHCYRTTNETEPLLNSHSRETVTTVTRSTMLRERWQCFILIWKLGVTLCLTTFASYVCRVSAAKAEDKTKYDQFCPELYASLQLCFQAAQFASLSSVQLVKIRRIEVLMVVQVMNAVVWLCDSVYKFLPVYILPSYMVFVGLISGAVYVNTFYMVHNDARYPQEQRELLANMTAVFITVGVSLCSILMTVLYTSVLLPY